MSPSTARSPVDPVGADAALAPPAPGPEAPEGADGVDPSTDELVGDAHVAVSWLEAGTPADASAERHEEAEGVPAARPLEPPAAKSSDAPVGSPPHALPRLALVGVPGDTAAVVQVDAFVGSSADARRPADMSPAPLALDRIVALTPESVLVTLDRLASASAVGPLAWVSGALPSGADGLVVVEVVAGALALVPGALAVVDVPDVPFGCGAVPLETMTGSLDGCSGTGRASGWIESRGSSARAALPPK